LYPSLKEKTKAISREHFTRTINNIMAAVGTKFGTAAQTIRLELAIFSSFGLRSTHFGEFSSSGSRSYQCTKKRLGIISQRISKRRKKLTLMLKATDYQST
jgi:hypothetical protein